MNGPWRIIIVLGDFLMFILSLFLMTKIKYLIDGQSQNFGQLLLPFFYLFLIWALIFFIFNLYDLKSVNPNPKNIGKLFIATMINILAGIVFFYFFSISEISPRLSLIVTVLNSFILLVIWRRVFYKIFISNFTQKIVLVGISTELERFKEEINSNEHIAQIIDHLDNLSKIESYTKNQPEQFKNIWFIVANNETSTEMLSKIVKLVDGNLKSLREAYEELFNMIPSSLITEETGITLISKREYVGHFLFRIFFDKIISSLILIITSPIILISIIAIYLETGSPTFYTQYRSGKNGRRFKLYKLRSMIKDSEINGAKWAEENDSRVTNVGKILRKTHIDEIPQMWNILKGDITFVGPRPERPEFVEKLEKELPYYFLRQTVKPGFTGWAQIKFRYARNVKDAEEKLAYDIYYLKNRNLLLDLGIIMKTIQIIFSH